MSIADPCQYKVRRCGMIENGTIVQFPPETKQIYIKATICHSFELSTMRRRTSYYKTSYMYKESKQLNLQKNSLLCMITDETTIHLSLNDGFFSICFIHLVSNLLFSMISVWFGLQWMYLNGDWIYTLFVQPTVKGRSFWYAEMYAYSAKPGENAEVKFYASVDGR